MKIDGKTIANEILEDLKKRIDKLKERETIPHLVVILINKDPASVAYVNQKKIKGKSIGAKIIVKHISKNISQPQLLKTIAQLNNNHSVHGIIVQRPLQKNIDSNKISLAIDPNKDVDGFHPNSKFQTPIALAVLKILKKVRASTRGVVARKKIVVIGKGETGGTPIIDMFKKMGVEPTVIDSRTPNPEALTKKADIIISAVGKPNVIKPEIIKKGVILIGVGLHKEGDGKLHGDYNDEKIKNIASFYTPTPGGVGPVNVAMLLKNLVDASGESILP